MNPLFIVLGTRITYGGVAQLGEHLPCKQGVRGSNPLISTGIKRCRLFFENFIQKEIIKIAILIINKTSE